MKNRMFFGTSILEGFWDGFGRVLGLPNHQKINKKGYLKTLLFLTLFLNQFFEFFCDLGSILGGPGASKIRPKIKKIDKKHFLDASWRLKRIRDRFFVIFSRFFAFWSDSLSLFHEFSTDFKIPHQSILKKKGPGVLPAERLNAPGPLRAEGVQTSALPPHQIPSSSAVPATRRPPRQTFL